MSYFEIARRSKSNDILRDVANTVGVCTTGESGIPAKGDFFTGDTSAGLSGRKATRVRVTDTDIPTVRSVSTTWVGFNPRTGQ